MGGPAQVFQRSTDDRLLMLAITLIGGPVLAGFAMGGAPVELLGVSLDNSLGRMLLVINSILLVAAGLQLAVHVLRHRPDIALDDDGISFYRFPLSRHVAWSDIIGIEQHEISYGFGSRVPNMRIQTERRAVSLPVKVDNATPDVVVASTLERWHRATAR